MSRWGRILIRDAWNEAGRAPYEHFPERAGVYVVYYKDDPGCPWNLLYVGSSENLRSRWKTYLSGQKSRSHISDVRFEVSTQQGRFWGLMIKHRGARVCGEHLMGEYRLIRRLRPPWNKAFLSSTPAPKTTAKSIRGFPHQIIKAQSKTCIRISAWADSHLVIDGRSILPVGDVFLAYNNQDLGHNPVRDCPVKALVDNIAFWYSRKNAGNLRIGDIPGPVPSRFLVGKAFYGLALRPTADGSQGKT